MEEKGQQGTSLLSSPSLPVASLPMTQDAGQPWGDAHFLWLVPIPISSVCSFAESPGASA